MVFLVDTILEYDSCGRVLRPLGIPTSHRKWVVEVSAIPVAPEFGHKFYESFRRSVKDLTDRRVTPIVLS